MASQPDSWVPKGHGLLLVRQAAHHYHHHFRPQAPSSWAFYFSSLSLSLFKRSAIRLSSSNNEQGQLKQAIDNESVWRWTQLMRANGLRNGIGGNWDWALEID